MKSKRLLRRGRHKPHSSRPPGSPDGAIGQTVKKLPTKNASPHVANEPLPFGGTTSKGQRKVLDSQGKTRFIDMKQGRVKGPGGVPVKG